MSIRSKIFFAFVASVVAGFALLAYWVTRDLRFRYSESLEEVMVDESRLLAEQLAAMWKEPPDRRFAALQDAMTRMQKQVFSAPIYSVVKTSADIRIYVTDETGTLVFDSRPGSKLGEDYSQWHDVSRTLMGVYGARTSEELLPDASGKLVTVSVAYVAAPIVVDGGLAGVVSLGKPNTVTQRFIDYARRKVIFAVSVASAIAIVLAWLLYAWVSRPMQALVEYANNVSEGREAKLPDMGDNEIGRVGIAMDSMRRALLDKEYVESYVQSLTHEVKSPLTAIRVSAELLAGDLPAEKRQAFVGSIEREVDRLTDISDRLLELAALERSERLTHVEPVAVQTLVKRVTEAMTAVAEARGVKIIQRFEGADVVRGDPLLLQQAFDNLLRNALDFSPPGSTIAVNVAAVAAGVQVTVQDEGPGIPEYAREKIFDRFYSLPRPASGRKSTGLGLNFAREVVNLHGGSVSIECPGVGTRARIFVPVGHAVNSP